MSEPLNLETKIQAWIDGLSEDYEVEEWDDPGDYPSNAGSAPLPSTSYILWLGEGQSHYTEFEVSGEGFTLDEDAPIMGDAFRSTSADGTCSATWRITTLVILAGVVGVSALVESVTLPAGG